MLNDIDLTHLPLLNNLSPDLVEYAKEEGTIYSYRDGEVIFYQGDKADCLIILLHGQVRIIADSIFLVSRKAYEVIGEQAFINHLALFITARMISYLLLPCEETYPERIGFECQTLIEILNGDRIIIGLEANVLSRMG